MCEFCHRHGEGQKWYLNAANYAEELFNAAARRSATEVLSALSAAPPPPSQVTSAQRFAWQHLHGLASWVARRHQQDVHWGQVVPLEDALQLVDMLDWAVRVPCTCRASTIGDRNARYCFGMGLAPVEEPVRRLWREALDPSLSVETLTREQAKDALTELDHRGAMHSVWTFKTPFIGGLCNCDRDCQAYRMQTMYKYQVMFRAEYVAQVDPDKCNGCRRCMEQCFFGAMTHSLTHKKCAVNALACYGCGVCRSVCHKDAISLVDRAAVPAAAGLWDL